MFHIKKLRLLDFSCIIVKLFYVSPLPMYRFSPSILTWNKNICAWEVTSTVFCFFCSSRATEISGFGRPRLILCSFSRPILSQGTTLDCQNFSSIDIPYKFRKLRGSFLSRGLYCRGASHVLWSWYDWAPSFETKDRNSWKQFFKDQTRVFIPVWIYVTVTWVGSSYLDRVVIGW